MFQQAKPIWIKGKSTEQNVFAAFRLKTKLPAASQLHITAATFYRVYINGVFMASGPARAPHGYARKDVLTISTDYAPNTECEILIEAVGYHCRSYASTLQPSFVMAEVIHDGRVLAYTGRDFEAFLPPCKVQKVERYSAQRHFCEVWDYRNFTEITAPAYRAEIEIHPDTLMILDRVAPYPLYEDVMLTQAQTKGYLTFDETLPYKEERHFGASINTAFWGCFDKQEIMQQPYSWIQRQRQTFVSSKEQLPLLLHKNEYIILDFQRIEAGFLKFQLEAEEQSDIVISFAEYYEGESFTMQNLNCHNVLEYFFSAGDQRNLLSFEPYTCRFVILAVKEGSIRLNTFGIKTFMYDISKITYPDYQDKTLNSIYRAAARTFAHNAVDIYTDCPSRERAGWLCDSYFTGRTEYYLTGKTGVEDAFLQNYRLYKDRGDYPKGVIPMCYPADANASKKFIPQWTMWYILEVTEYITKRGHGDQKENFRDSIYGLLSFYRRYENEDGLLEKLPSWNFVEWSEANNWTQDVNYPTNFLYAQVLTCIAELYNDEECRRRSDEVRKVAIDQSFNGQYFQDHSIRDEAGKLHLQEHSSEACQYYAVLFGGVDLENERYAPLKHLILNVFAPNRDGAMPQIMEVNAFIGAYLRMDTLLKMGEYKLLLQNISDFFGKMDEYTGTLWEFRQLKGSFDHGFASYALVGLKLAWEKLQ